MAQVANFGFVSEAHPFLLPDYLLPIQLIGQLLREAKAIILFSIGIGHCRAKFFYRAGHDGIIEKVAF